MDDAMSGRGGVVLVRGEAGIGKTRLVLEASRLAERVGARVAWGTCVADAPAYWPWRQVMRGAGVDERVLDDVDPSVDEGARFRLFETVADRLDEASREHPLVMVLDDLQWGDVPSIRLLGFVGRGLPTRAALLVGTYRDTEVGDGDALTDVTSELGAALSIVSLRGLGPEGVEWLLSERVGDLREGLASEVHARTGGNPFFVREVAYLLDESGDAAAGVPPAVTEVVRRQLAGCSDECSALLAAAATAGGALDLDLLSAVLDAPLPELVNRAEEARGRRILDRVDRGYRFRHDLVREAVLSMLTPDQQATIHWDVGTALAASSRVGHAEEAARHLRAGALAGDRAVAAEAAFQAAGEAMTALAFENAVDHLEWIVEQARRGTPAPDRVDELELLLMLGEARQRAGDWPGAGEAFSAAGDVARAQQRPEDLGRAALGFGSGFGGFEVPLIDHRQLAPLEEAARALAGSDSVVGAHVLARLAVAGFYFDEPGRREQLARDALSMADRTGDAAARAHALAAWSDMIAGPEHIDARLEASGEVVRLGRDAGSDELELIGHRLRVVALLEQGDMVEAEREARAFERVAQRYRLPIVRWYVPLWRGMRALLRGDLTGAEQHAHEAEVIGKQAGSQNAELLTTTLLEWIGRARGGIPLDLVERVRTALDGYLDENPDVGSARAVLMTFALNDGDLDEARRQLDLLVRTGFGERDAEWLGTLWRVMEACVALGDAEVAAEVADLLAPFESRFAIDGIGAAVVGSIGEALGSLDLVRGRRNDGEARLRSEIERYERIGAPLLAARARGRLGATTAARTGAPAAHGVMRREGDVWVLAYGDREVRVRDAKGLRDLAVLLSRPGREVHVSELTGGGAAAAVPLDVIDEEAKAAYRARIAELETEVADADSANDLERASQAREELEFLVDELAASLGVGGRARRAGDDRERARKAVTARLRYAIDRIGANHPDLGRHLAVSVRTGSFCVYAPDRPVVWDVTV